MGDHAIQPLQANDIRGNWATLILAWNRDDSLDVGRVAAEIDILIGCRVDGIYCHGTAGEFHTLSETEFDVVSTLLAERCEPVEMPFQIGVSHTSAQIAIQRLRRAVPLAPGAFQFILPDWVAVTNAEAYAFLQHMAEAAQGIGLVLYNPPHAKRVLSPLEVGKLAARVPALIGLKTAGGDDRWYAMMRQHLAAISVFVPGHQLASGIQRGAQGAYSNAACLHPAAAQRWTDQMQTDLPAALELEARLCLFMDRFILPLLGDDGYCAGACDRLLALIGGWADVGPRMRWPYRSVPASVAAQMRSHASRLIPEFVTG